MAVRIRLRRVGRKKQPSYRLVVAEARTPRDGAYIDIVGFYNPRREPAELRVDLEKVDEWLARGAELTETAASLVKKARRGGDRAVAVVTAPAPEEGTAPVETAPEAPAKARGGKAPAAAAAAPAAEAAPEAIAPEAAPEAPAPEAGPEAAAEAAPEAGPEAAAEAPPGAAPEAAAPEAASAEAEERKAE